jgi:hypothetical protein
MGSAFPSLPKWASNKSASAAGSFSSDTSRFFTGSPTDKAIWMLIGGALLSIVGVVELFRG